MSHFWALALGVGGASAADAQVAEPLDFQMTDDSWPALPQATGELLVGARR